MASERGTRPKTLWNPTSAQQMLAAVLEEEVNAFLGRHRYVRGKAFRGYRNGYHPARELTVGLGPVAVRVPPGGPSARGCSIPGVPL